MASGFALNDQRRVEALHIGAEHEPVIVIDDLLATPEALMEYVAHAVRFGQPGNYYPGLRGEPMPKPYAAHLIRGLSPLIGETFGVPVGGAISANFYFGLATIKPDALAPLQRLPHFDTDNPNQIALLHYLCDASHGGTAFFRHRATGYERIDASRKEPYFARLREEVANTPPPARYPAGDDALFAQTAPFEARFNRVLIYRSALLHSGTISPTANLSADPQAGRLTANLFLAFG